LSSGHDIYLEEPDARKEPATPTRLVVRGPSGEIELTADGPVLRFQEAALELQVEGNLRIESERLSSSKGILGRHAATTPAASNAARGEALRLDLKFGICLTTNG